MSRSLRRVLAASFGALIVGCSNDLTSPRGEAPLPLPAILDGARGGTPEFFWLSPTVGSPPSFSGVFDGGALTSLAVEVCALNEAATGCAGPVLERFTSTSVPVASRLRVDPVSEFYEARWNTNRTGVRAGQRYRVRGLRGSVDLGHVDVRVVRLPSDRARIDSSQFTAVVQGEAFVVRFRLELPRVANRVRINEVESNQGVPGDWVELHNSALVPIDLGGHVFRDNDDTRGYVIPAGTMIPAQGLLVLDEAQFGFGLGSGDQARLFAPDGTTLIDGYTWTAHASSTYGRCPDGTGAFATTSLVTRGAPNDCQPLAAINEVESSGGTPGDWIEIYNPNATPLTLDGHVLRDSDNASNYTLPPGTTVAPGAFLVIDEASLGFGLDASDAVRLYRPGGTLLVDSFTWTTEPPHTYGRCPDGAGALVATAGPTRDAPNACITVSMDIRFNEVESNGGSPGDWVELTNIGTAPVDLSGYVFKDNDDTHSYTIPAGTTIAPGALLILDELNGTVGQFDFGLGSGDQARLFGPGGATLVDSYTWTAHAVTTYARCPDGTGAFVTSTSSTRGTANDCAIAVRIHEVESSGGVPGDWAELYNAGPNAVDLSGYLFRDNAAAGYAIPAGTTIAPGGYLVLDEAQFGFGLGSADEARLFAPNGTTLVDSYAWTAHATTSYGRCPNGTGPFTTTGAPTKGTLNNCGSLALTVKINEVESSGGVPGDWVEFFNTGTTAADISGYVFQDNGTTPYALPVGSVVPAGGFLVLDEAQFGFGLGSGDDARLFAPDGTTLLDSYTWTTHAASTYGRCPDGTGAFTTTGSATKGAANACPPPVTFDPWPGSASITDADVGGSFFGGNMSGLTYESSGSAAPGVLWAARNGPGALFRLVWNGTTWVADTQDGWGSGKLLRYTDGLGDVDAEGVARVGSSIYVASERNNGNNGVSRNSILLYDVSGTATTLTAAREWDLTASLPSNTANTGLEGITFVPDGYLVAQGLRDEATNQPYNPATYANHNGGLFLVGVEATGTIYAFALDHAAGTFTRVATIASGFAAVMELSFDAELEQLWAVCDNTCSGRMTVLEVDGNTSSATFGTFIVTRRFDRPTGMPDLNNEGFVVGTQSECVGGVKPAYWSDDSQTGGVSLRRGTVSCTPF